MRTIERIRTEDRTPAGSVLSDWTARVILAMEREAEQRNGPDWHAMGPEYCDCFGCKCEARAIGLHEETPTRQWWGRDEDRDDTTTHTRARETPAQRRQNRV